MFLCYREGWKENNITWICPYVAFNYALHVLAKHDLSGGWQYNKLLTGRKSASETPRFKILEVMVLELTESTDK